jgi:hypothetical protein
MIDLFRLYPENGESSRFEVVCRRSEYSASRIARAVEDCDAHVLNLNVTSDVVDGDSIVVDLRVEHRNMQSVVRSLQRYGYVVVPIDYGAPEAEADNDEHEMSALERFLQI